MMHEVELGDWKAIFMHILRVLYALPGSGTVELNQRYVRALRNWDSG